MRLRTHPAEDSIIIRRLPSAVRSRRWILFAVIAIGFFVAAIDNDVYNLTSPAAWTWHVLLRKLYSIAAFALVGGAFVWASGSALRVTAMIVALYSGAIEVGQHITTGTEPLYWNVIDVICGAIGGAIGALIPWVRGK